MTIQHADTPDHKAIETQRFAKGSKVVFTTSDTLDEAQAGEEWIQTEPATLMEVLP